MIYCVWFEVEVIGWGECDDFFGGVEVFLEDWFYLCDYVVFDVYWVGCVCVYDGL